MKHKQFDTTTLLKKLANERTTLLIIGQTGTSGGDFMCYPVICTESASYFIFYDEASEQFCWQNIDMKEQGYKTPIPLSIEVLNSIYNQELYSLALLVEESARFNFKYDFSNEYFPIMELEYPNHTCTISIDKEVIDCISIFKRGAFNPQKLLFGYLTLVGIEK